MNEILFYIAQGLGAVAVVLGFLSFIQKRKAVILILQLTTALVFTAHYVLLKAYSAVPLNFLAAIACVFYYWLDKKEKRVPAVPVIFAVLTAILGILAWEGWHSALVIIGVVVSTLGLALPTPKLTRYVVLVKSPLCLAYNAVVFSVGGVVYECAILLSAILGLIRDRKEEKISHGI